MKKTPSRISTYLLLLFIIGIFTATGIAWWSKIPEYDYVPQFVLISFDGSRDVKTWEDIRLLKDELKKKGTSLNVTHFINAAYFLTPETKNLYQSPDHEKGKSNVGFAAGIEDVRMRIKEVNLALADGDEIESHTVGHYSGLSWTKEQWEKEFASFNQIMFHLDSIYPNAGLPQLKLKEKDIMGFRAPYLDKSTGLYDVLHARHFTYDSSEIGTKDAWPTKDKEGMWHVPLGTLGVGKSGAKVLAMDYNLYFRDSAAQNTIKKGTGDWNGIRSVTYSALFEYFNRNYMSDRAPVLVGYHFSMEWNDGVYWEAMKDFARDVCGKPEVVCGTFKDLIRYMEKMEAKKG